MAYPIPGSDMVRSWQSVAQLMLDFTPCDTAILRRVFPAGTEILAAASKDGSVVPGSRDQRRGSHLCEVLLNDDRVLALPDLGADSSWDTTPECQAGYAAYLGAGLRWPDGTDFGALELLSRAPLEDAPRFDNLLARLAEGINAQLEALYLRERGHFEATHDALTGFANRQLFEDLLAQQLEIARRTGRRTWLVLWEIDGYRELVEARGRHEADSCTRLAAERSRRCTRQSDILARLGENEFAVAIGEGNEFVATAVAERLRRSLHGAHAESQGGAAALSASCGVTEFRANGDFNEAYQRARRALEDARRHGGDRISMNP